MGGAGRRGGVPEPGLDLTRLPAAATVTLLSDCRERRLLEAIAPLATTCCRSLTANCCEVGKVRIHENFVESTYQSAF